MNLAQRLLDDTCPAFGAAAGDADETTRVIKRLVAVGTDEAELSAQFGVLTDDATNSVDLENSDENNAGHEEGQFVQAGVWSQFGEEKHRGEQSSKSGNE